MGFLSLQACQYGWHFAREERLGIPSIQVLLESGVHFGHQTSRWHPRMKPFICGRKNVIHIIDLKATLRGLIRGGNLARNLAGRGDLILLVGTKRQARSVVVDEAKRCSMPYVANRWLGGTLTNFETIRSRLSRLNELEEMESSGRINLYTKKEVARFRRELHKLQRNLGGIRDMTKLPGVLVVVDPGKEHIAVKEARKLEIPVVGLVDTDTDPELVDIVIPCNDDAFRSIKVLLSRIVDALIEGKALWEEKRVIDEKVRAKAQQVSAKAQKARSERRAAGPRRRTSAPRARSAPRAGGRKKAPPARKPKAKSKPEMEGAAKAPEPVKNTKTEAETK